MSLPSPLRRVMRRLRPAVTGAVLTACASPAAAGAVALADWAAGLPEHYLVEGVKTEPFTILHVRIWRDGDLFAVLGGAPGHEARAYQAVRVTAGGAITPAPCPEGLLCGSADGRAGFLATAAVVAAARAGRLPGTADLTDFAGHPVVCIDAERLGTTDPIFDPCLEYTTGAVLAQRHRTSGRFEGPSLSPAPLTLSLIPASGAFR